jgi:hypothetical protein
MTGLRTCALRLLPLLLSLPLATHAQKVKDVFEVGPSVYVRALTVEPARAALWVGTSAGVHEVDLASAKLRKDRKSVV